MTKRLPYVIALAAVMVSAACGGGGPTGPSSNPSAAPPPPTTVLMTVTDGDGQPISGPTVLVDGQPVAPNASGQYAAPPGHALDITVTNYIARQSTTAQGVFSLVELRRLKGVGGDQAYWQTLVFNEYMPGKLLSHPPAGKAITVSLSAELAGDNGVSEARDYGCAEATAGTNGRNAFSAISSGGVVQAVIDPNDPYIIPVNAYAVTYETFQGNVIVGSKIVFRDVASARMRHVWAHELGHTLGLGHSPDTGDLMYMYTYPNSPNAYSDRERYVLAMMAQRKTGTASPDNDRQAVGSLDRTRHTVVIVD